MPWLPRWRYFRHHFLHAQEGGVCAFRTPFEFGPWKCFRCFWWEDRRITSRSSSGVCWVCEEMSNSTFHRKVTWHAWRLRTTEFCKPKKVPFSMLVTCQVGGIRERLRRLVETKAQVNSLDRSMTIDSIDIARSHGWKILTIPGSSELPFSGVAFWRTTTCRAARTHWQIRFCGLVLTASGSAWFGARRWFHHISKHYLIWKWGPWTTTSSRRRSPGDPISRVAVSRCQELPWMPVPRGSFGFGWSTTCRTIAWSLCSSYLGQAWLEVPGSLYSLTCRKFETCESLPFLIPNFPRFSVFFVFVFHYLFNTMRLSAELPASAGNFTPTEGRTHFPGWNHRTEPLLFIICSTFWSQASDAMDAFGRVPHQVAHVG